MATACPWYAMLELDADRAEDVQHYLPTARFHYDMVEEDLKELDWQWTTAAPAACADYAYDGAAELAATFVEAWEFDKPSPTPELLHDAMCYTTDADLIYLASSLLAFFGEPRAAVANVKHHKIQSIWSATCATLVRLHGAEAGCYVLQIQDLGTDPASFLDVVWQATEFLTGCGISLWEPTC